MHTLLWQGLQTACPGVGDMDGLLSPEEAAWGALMGFFLLEQACL